jgi:cysteine desulfurase
VNQPRPIYLDYNATAPVKPAVADVVAEALLTGGNPSSVHGSGRAARMVVEKAREQVANLVGAAAGDVIFTSGGTEANNLCLRTFHKAGRKLLVSAVEHPSIMTTALELDATIIPVDHNGQVQAGALETLLKAEANGDGQPVLVSIMTANNETGVVQPIRELAEVAHQSGALLHTDAVQAGGKIPFDMKVLGADLVTISAHKIAGPAGSGALITGSTVGKMKGVQTGGGQEKGLRPGTENLSGIAGFGMAAELAQEDLSSGAEIAAMRDDLERRIKEFAPKTTFFGAESARISNTSCFAMPGVDSEVQVMTLDLEGIAISAGAACSSGKVTASPILLAMGATETEAASAIRVSLGWGTVKEDIEKFVAAWTSLYARLGQKSEELSAA